MLDIDSLNEISDLSAQKAALNERMDQRILVKKFEKDLYESAKKFQETFEKRMMDAANKGCKAIEFYDWYVIKSVLDACVEQDISSAFGEKSLAMALRSRPMEQGESKIDFNSRTSIYRKDVEHIGALMALKDLHKQGFNIKCSRPDHFNKLDDDHDPGHYVIQIDWFKPLGKAHSSSDFNFEIESLKQEVDALRSLDSLQKKYIELQAENNALKKELGLNVSVSDHSVR